MASSNHEVCQNMLFLNNETLKQQTFIGIIARFNLQEKVYGFFNNNKSYETNLGRNNCLLKTFVLMASVKFTKSRLTWERAYNISLKLSIDYLKLGRNICPQWVVPYPRQHNMGCIREDKTSRALACMQHPAALTSSL